MEPMLKTSTMGMRHANQALMSVNFGIGIPGNDVLKRFRLEDFLKMTSSFVSSFFKTRRN